MKTYLPKEEDIMKKWWVIDASDKTLGRLCTKVATVLMGKNKPIYTPHMDVGDRVIIVNAEKIKLTGNKLNDKMYYRHSGYPGGLKEITCGDLLKKHPERLIEFAVKGMLPRNKLRKLRMNKLKIYTGSNHPHKAQQPEELNI